MGQDHRNADHDRGVGALGSRWARLVFGHFATVLDFAVKLGLLQRNAARQVGNVRKVPKEVDFWSRDEFERVMSTFDTSDYYGFFGFICVWLFYMTGFRLGEGQARNVDSDFVFSWCGEPLNKHAMRHIVARHAALLISLGENALAIRDGLGHEDVKTTLGTYGHLYQDANRAVADRLDAAFSADGGGQPLATLPVNPTKNKGLSRAFNRGKCADRGLSRSASPSSGNNRRSNLSYFQERIAVWVVRSWLICALLIHAVLPLPIWRDRDSLLDASLCRLPSRFRNSKII